MSWHQHAACKDENPELFFPIGTTGQAQRQLQAAKRICAGCSVQSVCLEWAILAGIDHGVWGGEGEDERRARKRRTSRRRQAAEPRVSTRSRPDL